MHGNPDLHSQFEKSTIIWKRRAGHRGFGGGFGFGTPVVSYAPRPILQVGDSLVIMWGTEEMAMSECVAKCVELERGEQAA